MGDQISLTHLAEVPIEVVALVAEIEVTIVVVEEVSKGTLIAVVVVVVVDLKGITTEEVVASIVVAQTVEDLDESGIAIVDPQTGAVTPEDMTVTVVVPTRSMSEETTVATTEALIAEDTIEAQTEGMIGATTEEDMIERKAEVS